MLQCLEDVQLYVHAEHETNTDIILYLSSLSYLGMHHGICLPPLKQVCISL